MMPRLVFLSIAFALSITVYADRMDSVRQRLSAARNDSARIEILYRFIAKGKNPARQTDSLLEALGAFSKSGDCFVRGYSLVKLGVWNAQKERAQTALDYFLPALRIADSCDNKYLIMLVRARLAYVYKVTGNFKMSVFNAHKSLFYARQLKDSVIMAEDYTFLGNIYKSDQLLDSSLYYHTLALKIREREGDKSALAMTYNNLGILYKNKKEYGRALEWHRMALDIRKKTKDPVLYTSYNNIAIVFKHMGRYDSCIFYSKIVLAEGLKSKSSRQMLVGLNCLAECYDEMKDVKPALYYYKRLHDAEDSVGKDEISSRYLDLQSKYESDKKDMELKQKADTIKLAEARNSIKNLLIVFSFIALALAIVASVFIYRNYRQSKRNAADLGQKNREIEQKNKEITDSINYAQNIQQSLLTSDQLFKESLREHFILYLPKDIVSGDFYWAENTKEGFAVMCADCTGHGVPGAFMSLLGIGYLNEIRYHSDDFRPDLVLNQLRSRLTGAFDRNNRRDGMDASLIRIKGMEMEMAAANNPVWIIRNRQNMEIKPDNFPIGHHHGEVRDFSLNSFKLQRNDLVVMFTDGYADQFGGPGNKKFKYKRMESLVTEKSDLPLDDLKQALENAHREWKGSNEQVDDILIIGIRI